jgi:hypothetical protein
MSVALHRGITARPRRWGFVAAVVMALGGCRGILGIEDLRLADGGADGGREASADGGGDASFADAGVDGAADAGVDMAADAQSDAVDGSMTDVNKPPSNCDTIADASEEGCPLTPRITSCSGAECIHCCITSAMQVDPQTVASYYVQGAAGFATDMMMCICMGRCGPNECSTWCRPGSAGIPACDECATQEILADGGCHAQEDVTCVGCQALHDCLAACPP